MSNNEQKSFKEVGLGTYLNLLNSNASEVA